MNHLQKVLLVTLDLTIEFLEGVLFWLRINSWLHIINLIV